MGQAQLEQCADADETPRGLATRRSRGAQLWGITSDYTLVTTFQISPGGGWSEWSPWPATPQNSQFIEITACQQNDGRVELWGIDVLTPPLQHVL
jgi:hypothetical protein